MKRTRSLKLARETLAELGSDQLGAVAAAEPVASQLLAGLLGGSCQVSAGITACITYTCPSDECTRYCLSRPCFTG